MHVYYSRALPTTSSIQELSMTNTLLSSSLLESHHHQQQHNYYRAILILGDEKQVLLGKYQSSQSSNSSSARSYSSLCAGRSLQYKTYHTLVITMHEWTAWKNIINEQKHAFQTSVRCTQLLQHNLMSTV